jgi:hypothetical protein
MNKIAIFMLIILLLTSCDKVSLIVFKVENRLPFTIKVVSDSRRPLKDSIFFIPPGLTEIIGVGELRGKAEDYLSPNQLFLEFNSLKIYNADTILVKKDLLPRKEWQYTQSGDWDISYLLIIDQDDLK